jgi:L-ribulose-5-phosphate 3-epimerase
MEHKRRDFLKKMSGIGLGLSALPYSGESVPVTKASNAPANKIREICVFSKHLQFLDYDEMAETAAAIGFDGVDLTVRPDGHVLPENVEKDLPKAVNAVEQAGLKVPMITTAITEPGEWDSQLILGSASNKDVRIYRMGYLKYDFEKGIEETLNDKRRLIDKLVTTNAFFNIVGNYQNHDGIDIGATIWDLWTLFKIHDNEWIGSQYDIRHNIVEGGKSWQVDLRLISPYIHSLVIKDFKWGLVEGKWEVINTPIGEGMVDFPQYFKMVKELGIGGPVSMHFEYPLTDGPIQEMDPQLARKQVTEAMKKDLVMVNKYLQEAGLK